jgi:hypothetical protein
LNARVIGGFLALVIAAGSAVGYFARKEMFYRGVAETKGKEAAEWKAQAEEAGKWAAGYWDLAQGEKVAKDEALKALAIAKSKIPVPKPVPATSPELSKALGPELPGVKVYDDHEPSRLNRTDGERIWLWNQRAEMVPSLQASLTLAERALDLSQSEATHLRTAYSGMQVATENYRKASGADRERAEALEKVVKNLDREMKAKQIEKWLYVGGAVVAGFLGGRAIK